MGRLSGKVAIITGAANGIGKAGATRFSEEGASVVIADVSAELGQATADEIKSKGGKATFVQADITKQEQVQRLMDVTLKTYNKLDILYNNAGGSTLEDGTILETSIEEFWRVVSVDLFGTWLCCKHATPLLIDAKGGSIITTSSIVALIGRARRSGYSAAKGGVAALTRQMALDLAKYNIRVNSVAPGVTFSERIEARFTAANYSGTENLLGVTRPIEIAHMAVYLASDESRTTTGQVIAVDSGLTIS